jgi:glycosyltransferase involved in cell wall biosynthesis
MDLIEDKVNGYILEGEDKVDFAQRLIKLSKNPEMRIKMGQVSRSKAIEWFSLDEKVQEYVHLYKQLTMA